MSNTARAVMCAAAGHFWNGLWKLTRDFRCLLRAAKWSTAERHWRLEAEKEGKA